MSLRVPAAGFTATSLKQFAQTAYMPSRFSGVSESTVIVGSTRITSSTDQPSASSIPTRESKTAWGLGYGVA